MHDRYGLKLFEINVSFSIFHVFVMSYMLCMAGMVWMFSYGVFDLCHGHDLCMTCMTCMICRMSSSSTGSEVATIMVQLKDWSNIKH